MGRRLIAPAEAVVERGAGARFTVQLRGQEQPAFVVRYHGKVYAYLNACAHVPVELDWQEGTFFDVSRNYLVCSTHGALYEVHSGQCIAGPCRGRALQPLRVEEDAQGIWLLT